MHHLILGKTNKLQYVSVSLMTNEKCAEFWTPELELTENMICAGFEKNFCGRDSGKATSKSLQMTDFETDQKTFWICQCKALKSPI